MGADKIYHFIVGATIFMTLRLLGIHWAACIIMLLGIAVGKEVHDFFDYETLATANWVEHMLDIIATMLPVPIWFLIHVYWPK